MAMYKYIVMNTATGKAVQTWTFADRKHILYCNNPEWSMMHGSEDAANRTLEYLKKNFQIHELVVMKVSINTVVTFG